eukprot:9438697-Alexandrium_andersonii.AAC.1
MSAGRPMAKQARTTEQRFTTTRTAKRAITPSLRALRLHHCSPSPPRPCSQRCLRRAQRGTARKHSSGPFACPVCRRGFEAEW